MGGEIYRDSYESVINGWNTYQRIEKEYREMEVEFGGSNYGIKLIELELDKEYDVK